MYLLYLFLTISYKTLLPIDEAHADAIDIDIAINLVPVRETLIELDVVAIITSVSNDFNTVGSVLYFYISFLICCFCFEVSNHFFNVVDVVIKTVNITQSLFYSHFKVIIFLF